MTDRQRIDALLDQLATVTAQRDRYRAAWHSARRRARTLRRLAIRTANRNIALIAGIDTLEEAPDGR